MDTNTKIKKLELEKEIAQAERERDRSSKGFFINLLVFFLSLIFAGAILGLVPKTVATVAKKFQILDADGNIPAKMTWAQQARLDYIKGGMFVFVFTGVTTGIFGSLFRFRKGTSYQHKVEILKEELKKLEKER